jgi:hypothetical protein
MEDQHELEGFCFRCSAKDQRFDPTRHRVVHNAWPLLVPRHAMEYMRSQPLTRIFYSPIPLTDLSTISAKRQRPRAKRPHVDDQADFIDWLNWLHEYVHLWYLDWTPAKELAKTHLATSYALIQLLLFDDTLSDELAGWYWESFRRSTQQLAQIARNIGFVEELIATAMAIAIMEEQSQPGGMWAGFQDELAVLKIQSITQEATLFSGFAAAYARVERLVRLMRTPAIRAMLIPILQPVTYPELPLESYAIDARQNLDRILGLIGDQETIEGIGNRIRSFTQEVGAEWRIALGMQIDYAREPEVELAGRRIMHGQFAHSLWTIARGHIDASLEEMQASRIFLDAMRQGRWLGSNVLMLEPQRYRGRAIIGVTWLPVVDTTVPDDVQDAHFGILFGEGLRQQLLAKRGFVCPYSKGKISCQCKKTTRGALMRLFAYANNGLFGPGEWAPPPCQRR